MTLGPNEFFRQIAYKQETDSSIYTLLDIYYNNDNIIHIYDGNEWENGQPKTITSNGVVYYPYPFTVSQPAQGDDTETEVQLTLGGVSTEIIAEIRKVTTPIKVSFLGVLSDNPDESVAGPFDMLLQNVEVDATQISGSLIFDRILSEPALSYYYDIRSTPGLF